ncbi:hypothetical protein V7S43_016886 [Phytophthora oleae]|uniref:Uncharacterized protein n=1 Tax=Phytophthora oleae TaxID=2107226 RepID=A0ABD3EUP9_9STRA
MTEVDKIIASVKNNDVSDIEAEMRKQLRMNISETDVSERVTQYFKRCHDVIDKHGWNQFFTGSDGRQHPCRILIASLEPKALLDEVQRVSRFQARKAKEDEVLLHDLVLEQALYQERAYQSQKRVKRDRGDGSAERPPQWGSKKQPAKKPKLTSEPHSASPRPPMKTAAERPKGAAHSMPSL